MITPFASNPHQILTISEELYGIVGFITSQFSYYYARIRSPEEASQHIKLFILLNDFTLRVKTKLELPKQFGFLQAKPVNALSAIAVTPDELGDKWDSHMPDINLTSSINDQWFDLPNAATDYWFDYPTLIAHAAATRELTAGILMGAGTVSNASQLPMNRAMGRFPKPRPTKN